MIPSHNMRMRLAYMNHRGANGTLNARNHPLRAPLTVDPDNKDEVTRVFNSGGAGMFAKPQDYCSEYLLSRYKILRFYPLTCLPRGPRRTIKRRNVSANG